MLFCLFSFASSSAQLIELPQKDGKIYYEFIDSASGQSKDALYAAAKRWLVKTFNNAEAVIQSEDKEAGTIMGKGIMVYEVMEAGFYKKKYDIKTTIEITLKDDRYRLRFYDLVYVFEKRFNFDMESNYASYKKENSTPRPFQEMIEGLQKEVQALRSSLQKEMLKGSDDF